MTVQELNEIKEALEIPEIRSQLFDLQKQVTGLHKRFNAFWYKLFAVVLAPVIIFYVTRIFL